MASDITASMDVVVDKILGLGQFEALGKKIQKIVAKAVNEGLLEGSAAGQAVLRDSIKGVSDAGRASALKKLYSYSVRREAAEEKRIAKEAEAEQKRIERERRAEQKRLDQELARMAKAEAKQAERREKFEAAAAAYQTYSPYSTTTATASYAESTIARQHLQYMTRITNRDLISDANLRTATTQQLIERSRSNYEAANIRYGLPYNRLAREVAEAERQADRNAWRTALQSDDELARQIHEAEFGAVSDSEWRRISLNKTFGGDKIEAARERSTQREAEIAAAAAAEELHKMTDVAKTFGIVISGVSQFTNMVLRSKWQESVTRNITASQMAYYQRMEEGGQIIGGTIGAVIGAALAKAGAGAAAGSSLGPWGTILGGLMGAIGLGSLFGLPGAKGKAELEGVLKSADYVNNVRRDFLLYAGNTGYNLGIASEGAGFGSAAALNAMRWTSQTLPGAMALGMVGEQEMLMYSLMPEYFAASMAGADPATLALAYQKSVQRLPAQLRPVAATMVPGGSNDMYANAMDPQYSRFVRQNAYDFLLYDRGALGASEFFTAASRKRALADAMLMESELQMDLNEARRAMHKKYIDLDYTSALGAWGLGINSRYTSKGVLLAATPMYDKLTGKIETFENETPLRLEHEMYSGVIDAAKDVGEDNVSFYDAVNTMRKLHETGLNLTIRVEGLGALTQTFPMASMADGQSVTFNIGAQ